MRVYQLNDTIAAISTAAGESGIGIVRISGPDALAIAERIFVSKDGEKPASFKTYTVHYGWIVDSPQSTVHSPRCDVRSPQSIVHSPQKRMSTVVCGPSINIIDEVLLTVMRAPRSYTKEDIVEINCHGGIVALRRVLTTVLENGCRLAEPGEFTRRAFLNGRIDLTQAEAVLDIIKANTDAALEMGMEQLSGAVSFLADDYRERLLKVLASLEAAINFPDEDLGTVALEEFSHTVQDMALGLAGILKNSEYGKILKDGIQVVICGKPNVGKSSLLNAILRKERAIVTSIAGTTRDTIEEVIAIKDIPVRLVDTAGIMKPANIMEKHALARAKRSIERAELALVVFDASKKLTGDDLSLMRKFKNRPAIAVLNKMDLRQRIEKTKIQDHFSSVIELSAKKGTHIALLENEIAECMYKGIVKSRESILISNMRHIQALKKVQKSIAGALNSLDNELSFEFISQDIQEALAGLDELLGRNFAPDLLDKIFSEFCVGK